MRVVIYDRYPGMGVGNALLFWAWAIGARLQRLFGLVDHYYGAESWADAVEWLLSKPGAISCIQYWGHGSPGTAYLHGYALGRSTLLPLKPKLAVESVLWFRTCSSFQGPRGHALSERLANELDCTVAGHTRLIGLFQGGLHTRRPQEVAGWSTSEGELPAHWLPAPLRWWGSNTILCLRTTIPEGW